ncbi:hypothetical protein EDB84DRAFT_1557816 [Lactarius hengduanensis]|nr:hypothetical protein EDB84DRAFT_1557816 [Lactarius hengduanensis]
MTSVRKSLKLPLPALRHAHSYPSISRICLPTSMRDPSLRLPQADIAPALLPAPLIVDCATGPQPSPSSSSMSPSLSSILPEDEPDDESSVLSQYWPSEEKFRSRWSCSTLATLATWAAASPPTSPSPSARLHFHLGSVVRGVRARRTSVSGSDNAFHERAMCQFRQ